MEVEACQTLGYGSFDVDPSLSVTHLVRYLVEFVAVNEKRVSRYVYKINDVYPLHTTLRVTASVGA